MDGIAMATTSVHNAIRVAVSIGLLTLAVPAASMQAPPPQALSTAVTKFLDAWLVSGDANAAATAHLAPRALDERFVPVQFYRDEEYARLQAVPLAAMPLSRPAAAERFGAVLQRLRARDAVKAESLKQALAPVDQQSIPELWQELRQLDIIPRQVPGLAALAFPLRDSASYEWIGTETVGYRVAVPQMLAQGRSVEGVVCRIIERGLSKPWMLFMFWSNEGSSAAEDWRLLGVVPVPTE